MRLSAPVVVLLSLSACDGSSTVTATQQPAQASSASPTPSSSPTRDPARDGLPLRAAIDGGANLHSVQGADDHFGFRVENHGRDIQDLVVDAGPWLSQHTIAMGTSRACLFDLDAGLISCGPVYSGQLAGFTLRALPADVGDFHYVARFSSRENGVLKPIEMPDGGQAVIEFEEIVAPVK